MERKWDGCIEKCKCSRFVWNILYIQETKVNYIFYQNNFPISVFPRGLSFYFSTNHIYIHIHINTYFCFFAYLSLLFYLSHSLNFILLLRSYGQFVTSLSIKKTWDFKRKFSKHVFLLAVGQ